MKGGWATVKTHLDHRIRSLATHIVNGILVTEPVGAFHLTSESVKCDVGEGGLGLTVSYICHRQSSSVMFYECFKLHE